MQGRRTTLGKAALVLAVVPWATIALLSFLKPG
jgi:hypothetical protein